MVRQRKRCDGKELEPDADQLLCCSKVDAHDEVTNAVCALLGELVRHENVFGCAHQEEQGNGIVYEGRRRAVRVDHGAVRVSANRSGRQHTNQTQHAEGH